MASTSPPTGTVVFLRVPSDGPRELVPMRVVALGAEAFTAECEGKDLDLAAGAETCVYYKHEDTFLQRTIRIDAIMPSEASTVIGFTAFGRPLRAESRRNHRIDTSTSSCWATFDGEDGCPLLDVSPEGFALIATRAREVGDLVPVTLHDGDTRYSGTACIQNVQEQPGGRFRYGLQSVGPRVRGSALQRGQMQIGINAQRAELDQFTTA